MRTIAQISDIHFGRHIDAVAEDLRQDLWALRPDAVLVSGDLTQRAKSREFRQAQEFLQTLPNVAIVVPGNHDIPLYNLWHRFALPLSRYKKAIDPDLTPTWSDDELAVMGINTARSLTLKNGRISYWQMARIRQYFCSQGAADRFKVLVTHHPFLAPTAQGKGVGRYRRTLAVIEPCGLDLLLAGHFHMSYVAGAHNVYLAEAPSILVLQAGTAISDRTRGEPNAYNWLQVEKGRVALEVRGYVEGAFRSLRRQIFVKDADMHWQRQDEPETPSRQPTPE